MVDFFFFNLQWPKGLVCLAMLCFVLSKTLVFRREAHVILCLGVNQQLMPEIFRVVRTCYSLLLQLCAGYTETAKKQHDTSGL